MSSARYKYNARHLILNFLVATLKNMKKKTLVINFNNVSFNPIYPKFIISTHNRVLSK